MWDESEYLTQSLETFDYAHEHGLSSWPMYVVREQTRKPPLYVNTLAALTFLMGRDHAVQAAGVLAALQMAWLTLLVFRMIERAAGLAFGALGALAVMAMPGVADSGPTAFPDMQLSLIVLGVIAMLAGGDVPWAWLGLVLGLGLMSKASFPAFVALPLIVWSWRNRVRARALLYACAMALAIAGPWYAVQYRKVIAHAVMANDAKLDPAATMLRNAQAWILTYAESGIGYCLLFVVGLGLLAGWLTRSKPAAGKDRAIVLLLAGSLPALIYLLQAGWPSSRVALPALILLAIALILSMAYVVKDSRYRRPILAVCLVIISAHWAIAWGAETTYLQWRPRNGWAMRVVSATVPMIWREPATDAPVRAVNGWLHGLPARSPSTWYVSGNDFEFSVPRLQLAEKMSQGRLQFDWACYFQWPRQQCIVTLDEVRAKGWGLIVYTRTTPLDSFRKYMAQYDSVVEGYLADPTHKLRKAGELTGPAYLIRFYRVSGQDDSSQ